MEEKTEKSKQKLSYPLRAIALGIPTWSFIILSQSDNLINEHSSG